MPEQGSREYVFYVYDTVDQVNIEKRLDLFEVQNNARKLNKKEPGRYKAKGGWVLHRVLS